MNVSPAAAIQAAINAGYATAASILGVPFQVYRPTGNANPIAPANLFATLPATFAAGKTLKFAAASGYASPTWTALVDGSITRPGDYLVEVFPQPGSSGPREFFIAAQQPLLPILAIECNAVLTVSRPGPAVDEGFGSIAYGDAGPPTPEMVSFPASLLAGTKGEAASDGLPRDSRQPWYAVLFPAIPGIEVRTDDEITDARGYRYEVSSAELTDLGWKLSVMFTGT